MFDWLKMYTSKACAFGEDAAMTKRLAAEGMGER
jgi:hypothetical protein